MDDYVYNTCQSTLRSNILAKSWPNFTNGISNESSELYLSGYKNCFLKKYKEKFLQLF